MEEEFIKVPQKRIGTIIGKNGKTKRRIEENLSVSILVEDGTVKISKESMDDPLAVWKARDIVKAMARGFSPRKAFQLFKNGKILEIIDLKQYIKTKKELLRKKGRVIGKNGKTREYIEEMTGAYVSIYGKSISFVGEFEDVYDAKKAVVMILRGKPHSVAYKYLENAKKKKKAKKRKLWKDKK
ncbi:MAG: KH domain-containing protein [Euryarchaeota archaeon]|nr:KH domain-containing protein [Euryarchaeota archaeon]